MYWVKFLKKHNEQLYISLFLITFINNVVPRYEFLAQEFITLMNFGIRYIKQKKNMYIYLYL
jgi:hypothetical protein